MQYGMRDFSPRHINSATKYPSIPTYHPIDPKTGVLHGPATVFDGEVIGTEKIDGTNARIIVFPNGDWLIGSREELLTARGDFVHDADLEIVDSLRAQAEMIRKNFMSDNRIAAFYFELYGVRATTNWKHYSDGTPAWRLFDMCLIEPSTLDMPVEKISSWRQHGGQPFQREDVLVSFANVLGLRLAPRLFRMLAADLPTDIREMAEFLKLHSDTTLVAVGDCKAGRSEGIVLRTLDRGVIAKARHQDYRRAVGVLDGTIKIHEKQPKGRRLADVAPAEVTQRIDEFLADPDSGVQCGRPEREAEHA